MAYVATDISKYCVCTVVRRRWRLRDKIIYPQISKEKEVEESHTALDNLRLK